jgi:hypothetical protein
MANEYRGQIEVDFAGQPFVLQLSANSICALEYAEKKRAFAEARDFGLPLDQVKPRKINQILGAIDGDDVEFSDVRRLFWALMLESKPDATEADAGNLITGLGGNFNQVIEQAILAAFPEADAEGGEPGK